MNKIKSRIAPAGGGSAAGGKEFPKAYNPKEVEEKIYRFWERGSFFTPKINPSKKPFVVTIPPPNITGSLHMGHALNSTIQDVVVRFYRMNQRPTLWLPGTDHAGIATQNVVEKEIAKEGLTRHDLGRDKFVKRVWQWREKYGNVITGQLKKLGCSCDWSRTRFTLDKDYSQAVIKAFIHYFKKGYLYRGPRLVNWCPRCSSAISDIEVKHQERKGKLYYIKYPIASQKGKYLTVATTRPETMLGDSAIAVSPKDKRYKNLVGQKVILPLMDREIPVISDRAVDPQFGTGALKVTPAHDLTDWEIGQRHRLPVISVINEEGKITKEGGIFKGLEAQEAREKVVESLKKENLLEKQEDYLHSVSLCDRCSALIEPLISTQWFIKMKELAKPAARVVKNNQIRIIPGRYKKVYLNWLANIKDWCISRQLWWGHQIPAWHCQDCKEIVVSEKKPKSCSKCRGKNLKQDPDVLDTWFSSALWPFATLGWPKKTRDLKYFYPTTFLSTAQEIIYLWVARMVFSSLEFLKTIPFKDVYIHATVLTIEGKRMAKSLGTGVDPLELIDKYGADATRFGIIYQLSREQQAIKFSEDALVASRNFANKLWNIGRFINNYRGSKKSVKKPITLADKWILSRLNCLIKETDQKLKEYQPGEAARLLYDFAWHDLADWYLEISKIEKTESKSYILNTCYLTLLKLLHPFMPFITEEIWQRSSQKSKPALIVSLWPKADKKLINPKAEKEFEKTRAKQNIKQFLKNLS